MEVEAGVLLEAEEQAHLIKQPCILKCDLKVWKGQKVHWTEPGWYARIEGKVMRVAAIDPDFRDLASRVPVCSICLTGRRPSATTPKPSPVEEQTQNRADRIDMVYLEGKGENDEPISLALLPEEILYLQGDQTSDQCPHLESFEHYAVCTIEGCEANY